MNKYIRTNCIASHPVGTYKHNCGDKELKAGEQVSIEYKNDYIKLFQGDHYLGFIKDEDLLVDNQEEIEYCKEEIKYKTCTGCERNLPTTEFNKASKEKSKKKCVCKDCESKYQKTRIRDRRYQ